MNIRFRTYDKAPGFTADYALVRGFLLKLGRADYSYGRWDWMTTHPMLVEARIGEIGLWLDGDTLVGLAVFDTVPNCAYCLTLDGYEHLVEEIFDYAAGHMQDGEAQRIMIPDHDRRQQDIAAARGFLATTDKEADALYCDSNPTYTLPEGYAITSMADTYDARLYDQVLYKGFNHEGEDGPFRHDEERAASIHRAMRRPNVDLSLKVAVVAPNGDFVSYCGMWYDPAVDFAIVEPVATDPAYRRLGLGRAAVLEGIRRCYALGAKRAFVGSSQQFYYSIGFRPYQASTRWEKR